MATLEVQRVSGGFTEHLASFEVVIDDSVVGYLGPGASGSFEVPAGSHEVFVRIYWCRSEKVDVHIAKDQTLAFRCETRARLLTDGYWATLGRNRYLRLQETAPSRRAQATAAPEPNRVDAVQSDAGARRSSVPIVLMVGAGALSLASTQGLDFLITMAVSFIGVQAVIAINFYLVAPRSIPGPGINPHEPFRFRILEQVILSIAFALAGAAALLGLLHAASLAGWLAMAAAVVGVLNVIATRRRMTIDDMDPATPA